MLWYLCHYVVICLFLLPPSPSETCAEVTNEAYLAEVAKNDEFQEALVTTKERLKTADGNGMQLLIFISHTQTAT